MKEKMKNEIGKCKDTFMQNVVLPVTSFTMGVCVASMPVYAAGNEADTSEIETKASGFIDNLVSIIGLFGKYIGAALGAWGVIQLALAFKNEDADSKSRALMLIIAAIILFNVQAVINMLGLNVLAD
jgi:hypothetical protein